MNNKIIKIFLIILLLIIKSSLFGQDYEEFDTLSRNDFVINVSGGLGFYHLTHNDPKSDNLITVSTIANVGVSYFIANNIDLGFCFTRLSFPSNKDSAQSARTNLTSLSLRIYTLRSKKSNIYIGIKSGTSKFKFKNINTNTFVSTANVFIEPNIGFTHYWGKLIGMFLQSSFYYTKYDKIVNKENEPFRVTINGNQENFRLTFSGIKLQAGLLVKF